MVGVHRDAVDDVRPADAPQQRGEEAADHGRPLPGGAPARRVVLAPELERDAADDQRGEDQEQRQVEAGEQARVPAGEGRERRAAGRQQPHLVAVPDRADRVDDHALVGLVAAERADQHPDAEVEALEHEVADPQHADQAEPECLQEVGVVHGRLPFFSRRGSGRGVSALSGVSDGESAGLRLRGRGRSRAGTVVRRRSAARRRAACSRRS